MATDCLEDVNIKEAEMLFTRKWLHMVGLNEEKECWIYEAAGCSDKQGPKPTEISKKSKSKSKIFNIEECW